MFIIMKKIILLLITLLALFAMFSCGKNNGGSGDSNGGGNQDGTETGSVIWSSDIQNVIVVPDDESGDLVNRLSSHVFALSGKEPVISPSTSKEGANEILFGDVGRKISDAAYRRLDRFADLLTIKSEDKSAYLIYAEGGSLAIAFTDYFACLRAVEYIETELTGSVYSPTNGTVAKEVFSTREFIAERREEMRLDGLTVATEILGSEAVAVLSDIYALYTDELYLWAANLYDPQTGGFYYSESARNSEGYLPDLESTGQILGMLERSGLTVSWVSLFPEEMKVKLLAFVRDMQDENGWFYHPQWGNGITKTRRGRDSGWAKTIITALNAEPYYKWATDQILELMSFTEPLGTSKVTAVSKVVASAAVAPEYASKEAFINYLDGLFSGGNSYSAGNTINSTQSEIRNTGNWNNLREYLLKHQNPNNGLWEDEVSYQSVNGLMKLCTIFGSGFPNADKALASAIEIIKRPIDEELTSITFVYNPWYAVQKLLKAVGSMQSGDLVNMLRAEAASIFETTFEKLSVFRKDDGGFSYNVNYSSPTSQGVPVAISGSAESDVNATSIAVSTLVTYMLPVLGVEFPKLYTELDERYFIETFCELGEIVKNPNTFSEPTLITFDDYNPEEAQVDGNVVMLPHEKVSSSVGDPEVSDGKYKWFNSSVLQNPDPNAKEGDLVLYAGDTVIANPAEGEKAYGDTGSATVFEIENPTMSGNMYVFQADLMYESATAGTAPALQLMFSYKTWQVYNSATLNFYEYSRFGQKYLRIQENFAGVDGVKDNEVASGIPIGEWFNLRVECYKDYVGEEGELTIRLKIYINGELAGVSDSGNYSSSTGTYTDYVINQVRMAYYRSTPSAFYINNAYCYKNVNDFAIEGEYIDNTDREVSDKKVWDYEDNKLYSESDNFSEIVYKDDSGVVLMDPINWNSQLEKDYGVDTKAPGVRFYTATDPTNSANKVLKAYAWNTDSTSYTGTMYLRENLLEEGAATYEIEFDYYFEDITWLFNGDYFSLDFMNSAGKSLAGFTFTGIEYATNSTKKMEVRLTDGSTFRDVILRSGRWYSFRVRYYIDPEDTANSRLKLYVLSEDKGYVCIGDAPLAPEPGTIEYIGFSFYPYKIRGVQYLDDISAVRRVLPYEVEEVVKGTEVNIPGYDESLDIDRTVYITESQRGKGAFYDKSIHFNDMTYNKLIELSLMAKNLEKGDGIDAKTRELSIRSDRGDYALQYKTKASGFGAFDFLSIGVIKDNFVFETDLKLEDILVSPNRKIRFVGSKTNGAEDAELYSFALDVYPNPKTDGTGYALNLANTDQLVIVPDGTWINVRVVANGLAKDSPLLLYVNGNLVVESTLKSAITGISSVEVFTQSTNGSNIGWVEGTISLDNVYVGNSKGENFVDYTKDAIEITETSRGKGAYYANAVSYAETTLEKLIADGIMITKTKRGDGVSAGTRTLGFTAEGDSALSYTSLGSDFSAIDFVARNEIKNNFVFETDIMLSGVDVSESRSIRLLGTSDLSGKNDAKLYSFVLDIFADVNKSRGGYILKLANCTQFVHIQDAAWVNIRMVAEGLTKDSALKLYVNGTLVLESTLKGDITGIKGVEMFSQTSSGANLGWTKGTVNFDNTYCGNVEAIDSYPSEEPDTPDTPEAPDVSDYGENMDDAWDVND